MGAMNDQEMLGLFDPLYARFANTDRLTKSPPLLAHYTSIRVMERILQSNEVWFSNPLFMNDMQEMRFGLNEGTRLFSNAELQKQAAGTDSRAAILQHAFSHFFRNFDSQDAFDTYVFCLSEHDRANTDGLLSMWRGYGQHGNGAALVFDVGAVTMVPTSPLIISKVSYASDEDRVSQLEGLLRQWAEISQRAELPDDKLYLAAHAAFSAIKMYALTTKHKGFSEEAEWRVIYYPDRDRAGVLKQFLGYHIGDRGVEPKLKYPIGHIAGVSASDLALERILERIILGPSVSSPLAKRSVERMLENIGKSEFKNKLHTSGIPLRPVSGSSF
jgi:Protein of unknown function (DUF2971)